jgi:hypothetical protein
VEDETSVAVMARKRNSDALIQRALIEQEKFLGCLRVTASGHHWSFEVEIEAFVPVLRRRNGLSLDGKISIEFS